MNINQGQNTQVSKDYCASGHAELKNGTKVTLLVKMEVPTQAFRSLSSEAGFFFNLSLRYRWSRVFLCCIEVPKLVLNELAQIPGAV